MRPLFRLAKASLITVRSAVIMAIASVVGAAAGVLTYMASRSIPQALLAAGAATGGSANLITGTDPGHTTRSQDDKQHDDQDDSARQRET